MKKKFFFFLLFFFFIFSFFLFFKPKPKLNFVEVKRGEIREEISEIGVLKKVTQLIFLSIFHGSFEDINSILGFFHGRLEIEDRTLEKIKNRKSRESSYFCLS